MSKRKQHKTKQPAPTAAKLKPAAKQSTGPKTLTELNRVPKWVNILLLITAALLIAVSGGLYCYHQYQLKEASAEKVTRNVNEIVTTISGYDSETAVIKHLEGVVTPVARIQIGSSRTKLPTDTLELTKNASGMDYRLVDYFKVKNTPYYIRSEFGNNTDDTYRATSLSEKQYRHWYRFDSLQSDYQARLTHHQAVGDLPAKIQQLQHQYPYLKD